MLLKPEILHFSPADKGTFCISASGLNLDAPEFIPSYMSSATSGTTESNSGAFAAGSNYFFQVISLLA